MEILLLLLIIVLLLVFDKKNRSLIENMQKDLDHIKRTLRQDPPVQNKRDAEHSKPANTNPFATKTTPPVANPYIVPEPKTSPINTERQEKQEEIKKEGTLADSNPNPINVKSPAEEKKEKELTEAIQDIYKVRALPVAEKNQQQASAQNVKMKEEVKEDFWDRFRKKNPDLEKFIGENLISKIGVAILVLGIGYFVKYAIDQNWINETARVGIGILCGVIVMVFAHKLRSNFKAFSSVLVAGAVAIFYFTIAIAFHQYHLFSQTVAFSTMLVITSFSVFISLSYNRIELAALSLIGGFATPLMVSNGGGNYIVLFTYIAILDIGMLVMAYFRSWNLITILSYIFTELLFLVWFIKDLQFSDNPPYNGALFFAGLFYLLFLAMSVINNIKEKRNFSAQELTMVISNTFIFYGLSMQLMQQYYPDYKGLFTILLALFNCVCSWFLYRYFKSDKKLIYSLIGLTLTFATLAIPIQLKGHYITLFWSAEVVLLLWLSQRSNMLSFRFTAILVFFLAFISLLMDWILLMPLTVKHLLRAF